MADFPPVPLTLEGSSLLHQFFRFGWPAWRSCAEGERQRIAAKLSNCSPALNAKNAEIDPAAPIQTALFSQLGHKGDLILVHFRDSMEALNQVELDLAQTDLYRLPRPAPLLRLGRRTRPLRVHPQELRSRRHSAPALA